MRNNRTTTYLAPVASLVIVLVASDLALKWLMTEWLGFAATAHAWWLVEGQVGFEYARNSGAAFGVFEGNADLLAALSVVVACAFCYLIFAEVRSRVIRIASAGLILGGAIGNLIERVRHGYVTDFIAIGPWPRFNLADSAISIAVVVFVISVLFEAGHDSEEHSEPNGIDRDRGYTDPE